MSMHTIMEGSFKIEPPLTHQELKKIDKIVLQDTYVKVVQEEIETDEGTLVKRSGTEIRLAHEDERVANYRVAGELQRLFDLFKDAPSGETRNFNGSIFCIFEEIEGTKFIRPLPETDGDKPMMVPTIEGIWRYEERGGKLVTKHPIISGWTEKEVQ